MKLLLLRLEGVMQSWGEDAKWDNRPTASFPTKSGIVGLIACCMGLERGDERIERIARSISVSSRADRGGKLMTDFHTVTSDEMPNAEGKASSRTIISPRQYLQDASFLCAVSSEDETLLDEVAAALATPVWTPYLGRKSCVPSAPVLIGLTEEYEDAEAALRSIPFDDGDERIDAVVRMEIECSDGYISRKDSLADASLRTFSARQVRYSKTDRGEQDVSVTDNA